MVRHLLEGDAIVTAMINYYGIKDDYDYPLWDESKMIGSKTERMRHLEKAMQEDIPEKQRSRFIPHLQLHEFESLLFSDLTVFSRWYSSKEMNLDKLQAAIKQFHYPEDINDIKETSPSKRVKDAIPGYSKIVDENMLAMDIGLQKMLQMCPHFNEWFSQLQAIR